MEICEAGAYLRRVPKLGSMKKEWEWHRGHGFLLT